MSKNNAIQDIIQKKQTNPASITKKEDTNFCLHISMK